jgi:hypothetical protein
MRKYRNIAVWCDPKYFPFVWCSYIEVVVGRHGDAFHGKHWVHVKIDDRHYGPDPGPVTTFMRQT